MKLVHRPSMAGLLHLVQRRGDWAELQPAQAGVPITVLLYSSPLLCGFNMPVKELTDSRENLSL